MVEWYNGLDLFLTTGCAEGGPSPPLEALSCGVPVIGTDSGLLREVIFNGYNGYLIKSYRTKEQAKDSATPTFLAKWQPKPSLALRLSHAQTPLLT